EGTLTPRQSPSGMHSHRAVSVCIQSGGGDTGSFFLLRLCTGRDCTLARLLPHSGHKPCSVQRCVESTFMRRGEETAGLIENSPLHALALNSRTMKEEGGIGPRST
ncbi:hypothetical protein JOQ06_009966, partial [Pogonophryne albipinna]